MRVKTLASGLWSLSHVCMITEAKYSYVEFNFFMQENITFFQCSPLKLLYSEGYMWKSLSPSLHIRYMTSPMTYDVAPPPPFPL